ncbi:MAG TPA: tetratricopeptide repeat protein [Candidatus Limnocylindria bacterium]|nr:tetratricopeptide repeat protein [Candidatus Limnocylindria bacterium]
MTPLTCPDCGHKNPPGSESCEVCHYPLVTEDVGPPTIATPAPPAASTPATPPAESAPATPPPAGGAPPLRRMRPIRPRRPRPETTALSLWLGFGGFCILILLYIAIQANVERARTPIAGSTQAQQQRADELRTALDKDTTNTQAHVALGDVLYDTGNWSEAIVHYRAALNRDSSLSHALVDLGVCYYNLGETTEAERHFRLALERDPHHPVALFNLGIVHERRSEWDQALQYFHRALQSDPPEGMRPPLVEAMARVQEKTGKPAPPLPDGR